MLKLINIKKSYQENNISSHKREFNVLSGVNLSVKKGDITSIVGSSGSGKSTILNIMGLLDNFNSGKMLIDGNETSSLNTSEKSKFRNKYLGFVFQANHLIPELTAIQNISIPLLISNIPKKEAENRAKETILKVLNKEEYKYSERIFNARPSKLSGGQCQRISLARAIVNHPKIILADEPTGALDKKTSSKVMDLLFDLNTQIGSALIIVTHAMDVADSATNKLILENGILSERK